MLIHMLDRQVIQAYYDGNIKSKPPQVLRIEIMKAKRGFSKECIEPWALPFLKWLSILLTNNRSFQT
jgi:hypothetical protein